jgi:hypothetical protein
MLPALANPKNSRAIGVQCKRRFHVIPAGATIETVNIPTRRAGGDEVLGEHELIK